jgi:hypothetical protein
MCQIAVPGSGFFAAIRAKGRSATSSSVTHQATSGVLWWATTRRPSVRPSLSVSVPRCPTPDTQWAAVSTSQRPSGRRGPTTVAVQPALPKRMRPRAPAGSSLPPPGGLGSGFGGTGGVGGTGWHCSISTVTRASSTCRPSPTLRMTSSSTS